MPADRAEAGHGRQRRDGISRVGILKVREGSVEIVNAEMKALMINATEHLAKLLRMRDQEPDRYREYVRAYGSMYCRSWDRVK